MILIVLILIIIICTWFYLYYQIQPLNIIQTWKTLTIPKKYQKFRDNLKKFNPNANHIFFTDKDITDFINLNYPEYKDTFDNFKYTIQKIDFFRYLAIYHYGGVYLDLDVDIIKSFKNLDTSKAVFPIEFLTNGDGLLRKQGFKILIGNYAFYAPKKHAFLKKIIDNIVNNRIKIKIPNDTNNHKYVYYTTGPVMVSQSFIDYKQKKDIKLIKPQPFERSSFGEYGKHRNMGSWK